MLRTTSTTDLRTEIKRVLNEVGYGQAQYVVEKFGEPTAAILPVFCMIDSWRFSLSPAVEREAGQPHRNSVA